MSNAKKIPFYKKQAEKRHLKRIKELEKRLLTMQRDYAKEVTEDRDAIRTVKDKLVKIYFVRGDMNNYDKYQW